MGENGYRKHLRRHEDFPARCDNILGPVDTHYTQTVHTSLLQHDSPSVQINPRNKPDVYCQYMNFTDGADRSLLCSKPSIIPFARPNRRYSGDTVIAVT